MTSTSLVSRSLPLVLLLLPLVALSAQTQDRGAWNGKRCAVALTYDDALDVHLDNVVPLLDSLEFKGTFYLSTFFPSFQTRMLEWVSVAKKGHELGNHTLFHPCEGKAPGREWVPPDYDLNRYSVRRMIDEIQTANMLLQAMDGQTTRTFAYPCGDKKAGDSSYVGMIKARFPGARGVEGRMQRMEEIDLYDIGAYMINGQSGDGLIRLVQEAMTKRALVVFLFHGVGGGHSLTVSAEDHQQLLSFLKANERDIWIAPMCEICEYLKAKK
jgi:peptidoglycan/xylan/chitin deacetylase (PgdA/CDA1 family)